MAEKAAREEKAKLHRMAIDGMNADRVDDGAAVSYTSGPSAAAASYARTRDLEHALKGMEATLREREVNARLVAPDWPRFSLARLSPSSRCPRRT